MYILISNDDGVEAPGIKALYQALADYGNCQVLAPMHDMSGASNALTLNRPLYPHYFENGFIGLDGTPADCVHMGVNGLLKQKPDLVVSGINLGANLGDDVLYSVTVAAATEGRFTCAPSFAFSLVSRSLKNMPTAAYFARKIVDLYSGIDLPPHTVLNVNIPDLTLEQIKGIRITRLGHRTNSLPPVTMENPRGKIGYWVASCGDIVDDSAETDFCAINDGYVSITPLQVDRSNYVAFNQLRSLERELS